MFFVETNMDGPGGTTCVLRIKHAGGPPPHSASDVYGGILETGYICDFRMLKHNMKLVDYA